MTSSTKYSRTSVSIKQFKDSHFISFISALLIDREPDQLYEKHTRFEEASNHSTDAKKLPILPVYEAIVLYNKAVRNRKFDASVLFQQIKEKFDDKIKELEYFYCNEESTAGLNLDKSLFAEPDTGDTHARYKKALLILHKKQQKVRDVALGRLKAE